MCDPGLIFRVVRVTGITLIKPDSCIKNRHYA
jgi:hypothetical protein